MYAQGRFLLSGLPQADETISITPLSFRFTTDTGTSLSSDIYIGDITTVAELAQRMVDVINVNDVPGTASVSGSNVLFTPYSEHTDEIEISSQASNISVEGVGTNGVIVIGS